MPRIYDGYSNPIDFCKKHFPKTEENARQRFGKGTGPDNRGNCFGYEAEHPPYVADIDYRCATCHKVLDANDD